MRVRLKALGHLAEYFKSGGCASHNAEEIDVRVESGTTVSQILLRYGIPEDEIMLLLLNGRRITDTERTVADGDVLELIPTFAGG